MNAGSGTAGGHRPRKRFGQHFLHDPSVIDRILRAVWPEPGDRLVEIGPGLGALTRPLLERAARLDAIELDRDVLPELKVRCAGAGGELAIHSADALTFDFSALGTSLRIVGNLPYNISTPLLFHLLRQGERIRDMHLMLQREVVERMAAGANEPAYGRLSATLAARSAVEPLFRVGRGAFTPPPQVESAVVRVTPAPPPFALSSLKDYDALVTRAFSQRRKTLSNALRGLASAEALKQAGIDPGLRAENVSPRAFGELSLVLAAAEGN